MNLNNAFPTSPLVQLAMHAQTRKFSAQNKPLAKNHYNTVKSYQKPTTSSKAQATFTAACLTTRDSKLGKKKLEVSASKASYSPMQDRKEGLQKAPSRLVLDFKPKPSIKPSSVRHKKPLLELCKNQSSLEQAEQPRLLAPNPIQQTTLQDKICSLKTNLQFERNERKKSKLLTKQLMLDTSKTALLLNLQLPKQAKAGKSLGTSASQGALVKYPNSARQ